MLIYFDTTFFSVMQIMDTDNKSTARKAFLPFAYMILSFNIVLPIYLIVLMNRRFTILNMKEAKQSFNSLLLRIDKASRWRIMNPAYFFVRRLFTAMLLTLPEENSLIYLRYIFILAASHTYIIYMVAIKPYQTPDLNSYVLVWETFYSALTVIIFIFSDATSDIDIKSGSATALLIFLILLQLMNISMSVYYLVLGPTKLKEKRKEAVKRRAMKEAFDHA